MTININKCQTINDWGSRFTGYEGGYIIRVLVIKDDIQMKLKLLYGVLILAGLTLMLWIIIRPDAHEVDRLITTLIAYIVAGLLILAFWLIAMITSPLPCTKPNTLHFLGVRHPHKSNIGVHDIATLILDYLEQLKTDKIIKDYYIEQLNTEKHIVELGLDLQQIMRISKGKLPVIYVEIAQCYINEMRTFKNKLDLRKIAKMTEPVGQNKLERESHSHPKSKVDNV